MLKEVNKQFRFVMTIVVIFMIVTYILLLKYNYKSVGLLLLAGSFVIIYFSFTIVKSFKFYSKHVKVLTYKLIDNLFSLILILGIITGLYFETQSSLIFISISKATFLLILQIIVGIVIFFFYIKKMTCHIPIEFSLIKLKNRVIKNYYFILFLIVFLLPYLHSPIDSIPIENGLTAIIIALLIPITLFLLSTWIDLISFQSEFLLPLRILVHFLDSYVLYFLLMNVTLIIPNLGMNQSLTIPFYIIIPTIYFMNNIRERILALNIENKK